MKKVGAGSFGTVYLAEHKDSKKFVAIKVESVEADVNLLIYEAHVNLYI